MKVGRVIKDKNVLHWDEYLDQTGNMDNWIYLVQVSEKIKLRRLRMISETNKERERREREREREQRKKCSLNTLVERYMGKGMAIQITKFAGR